MFRNCESLKKLDISRWDLSRAADTENMFKGCAELREQNTGSQGSGQTAAQTTKPGATTTGGQSTESGAAQAGSNSAVIHDPDAFFQNKMVRDGDLTSDTGSGTVQKATSGGGYDGVRPGTWERTPCSDCGGKGWTECHVCRGRGWVGG